ncbi:MAG: mannose-1-phosphate guanylyltransferase [Bacteroidales bacterium]|nr:mannose-1-phosphate guanylyltransferase [Bacteroidales bacterium]
MNSNNYCVIMAGGVGSRFWPVSRTPKPKQFLDILGTGRTLIQQTYDRFQTICPPENFIVVTSDIYEKTVIEQLPEIPAENILTEPARRNTAPCIAYAAYKIRKKNPGANMIVTPADHLVIYVEQFREVIKNSINFAADRLALVTVGIKPTRPETGYGYIQICNNCDVDTEGVEKVKMFTEKPNIKMAQLFLDSGEFLWNSGIFIWSVKTILNSMFKYLPDVNILFDNLNVYDTDKEKSFIDDVYSKVPNISIDFGVMEKAENVYVIPAEFGWSDLGTWGSLYDYSEKDKNSNVIKGANVLVYNTENSIINVSDDKFVVIHGLKNAIVAESDGIFLVSMIQEEQKIKDIVNDIKIEKGEKYV